MTAKKAPAKKVTAKKSPAKTSRKRAPTKATKPRKAAAKKASAKKAPPRKAPGKSLGTNGKTEGAPPAYDPTVEPEPAPLLSAEQLRKLAIQLTPDGVADPPQIAWEAKQRGYTWPQAARIAGYESAEQAQRAARAYVKRAVVESGPERRAEALELADAQLNAIIGNAWERARRDPTWANVVLATIRERNRLWRLYEPSAEGTTQRVIVIAGTRDEYVGQLQEVVRARATRTPARELPAPGPEELLG